MDTVYWHTGNIILHFTNTTHFSLNYVIFHFTLKGSFVTNANVIAMKPLCSCCILQLQVINTTLNGLLKLLQPNLQHLYAALLLLMEKPT